MSDKLDLIRNILQELAEIYEAKGDDKFRTLSYRKAVDVLTDVEEIKDLKDLKRLPGIGNGIYSKIEEIYKTGKLQKLEELSVDSSLKTIKLFTSIQGVGPKTAQKWWDAGYRTLEDVVKGAKLTTAQKLGIKFVKDSKDRIPRDEVTKIYNYIDEVAKSILPGVEVIACGSYRRGLETCGDIDLLFTYVDFTREKTNMMENFFDKLLNRLGSFITGKLNDSKTNFMGYCKIDDKHRRIDIKIYPYIESPYAILYFTGSKTFGQMIRGHAKTQLGMSLSDQNLTYVTDGSTVSEDICSEEDILNILGIKYLTPAERENPVLSFI